MKNVRVVLVRPRGGANVGSVARAMKNMGLRDLVLVRPRARRSLLSRSMAVHAADVLEKARVVRTLEEAIADCSLVIGTSARRGGYHIGAASPRELAPAVVAAARKRRVALVFGPEDHGLANDDLKHCNRLMTIPSSADYSSLNLAQAVMVCAYEIFLAAAPAARKQRLPDEKPDLQRAPAKRVDFLFQRLQQAFLRIGFLPPQNPEHIMFALRRLLGRAGLEEREVRILLALARQIEWYGNQL